MLPIAYADYFDYFDDQEGWEIGWDPGASERSRGREEGWSHGRGPSSGPR